MSSNLVTTHHLNLYKSIGSSVKSSLIDHIITQLL